MPHTCCYDSTLDPNTEQEVISGKFTYKTKSNRDPRLVGYSALYCAGTRLANVDNILDSLSQDGAIQLFTTGTTSWNVKTLDSKIRDALQDSPRDVALYVHCPFTMDISKNDKAVRGLQRLLNSESGINKYCILHPGNGTAEMLAQSCNSLRINNETTLLLETSAKNNLGSSIDSIRSIYEGIDSSHRVSVCVDTQHLYASGMCKFSSHSDVVTTWDSITNIARKPKAIHLNDSDVKYNSKKDRHSALCEGYIWKSNSDTLYDICDLANEYSVPLISETGEAEHDRGVLSFMSNMV